MRAFLLFLVIVLDATSGYVLQTYTFHKPSVSPRIGFAERRQHPTRPCMIFPLATPLPNFGNIAAAVETVVRNPESALCSLDSQRIEDNRESCQLLNDVVRVKAGRVFVIRQDWGGSYSTGGSIWPGASMAAWHLENCIGSKKLTGANVIELGSGVGFISLMARALGADNVVITDGDPDVVNIAQKNVEINFPEDINLHIRAGRLRWNTPDVDAYKVHEWDYILASDCTYRRASWGDLMQTIADLSGPKTRAILEIEPRSRGEVEGVLAEARRRGLAYREEALPIDQRRDACGVLCSRLFTFWKEG